MQYIEIIVFGGNISVINSPDWCNFTIINLDSNNKYKEPADFTNIDLVIYKENGEIKVIKQPNNIMINMRNLDKIQHLPVNKCVNDSNSDLEDEFMVKTPSSDEEYEPVNLSGSNYSSSDDEFEFVNNFKFPNDPLSLNNPAAITYNLPLDLPLELSSGLPPRNNGRLI